MFIGRTKEASNHFPYELARGCQRGLTLGHGFPLYYIKFFLYGLRRASKGIILGMHMASSDYWPTTLPALTDA